MCVRSDTILHLAAPSHPKYASPSPTAPCTSLLSTPRPSADTSLCHLSYSHTISPLIVEYVPAGHCLHTSAPAARSQCQSAPTPYRLCMSNASTRPLAITMLGRVQLESSHSKRALLPTPPSGNAPQNLPIDVEYVPIPHDSQAVILSAPVPSTSHQITNHWCPCCSHHTTTASSHPFMSPSTIIRFHIVAHTLDTTQPSPCDDENVPAPQPSHDSKLVAPVIHTQCQLAFAQSTPQYFLLLHNNASSSSPHLML
jgi:hypothetical protein